MLAYMQENNADADEAAIWFLQEHEERDTVAAEDAGKVKMHLLYKKAEV